MRAPTWRIRSALLLGAAFCPGLAPLGADAADTRIEARSADQRAVGIVRGERMSIHLTRIADNAPIRDAVVNVALRGVVLATVAEADGSYVLTSRDLTIPGLAAVDFEIHQGPVLERLHGTLSIGDPVGGAAKPEDKNGARQLGWWVLNFAVCIGFLALISRRRKAAKKADAHSPD
ncbi:MAG: hypothetical protein NVS2B1_17700 [Bradyrhizobium sp.]